MPWNWCCCQYFHQQQGVTGVWALLKKPSSLLWVVFVASYRARTVLYGNYCEVGTFDLPTQVTISIYNSHALGGKIRPGFNVRGVLYETLITMQWQQQYTKLHENYSRTLTPMDTASTQTRDITAARTGIQQQIINSLAITLRLWVFWVVSITCCGFFSCNWFQNSRFLWEAQANSCDESSFICLLLETALDSVAREKFLQSLISEETMASNWTIFSFNSN